MSQYKTLDALILKAIEAGRSPLYYGPCDTEATRIAEATGRKSFRVLDGRLQALRRAGRVRHTTKAEASNSGGWKVVA